MKMESYFASILYTLDTPSALGTMFLERRVVVRREAISDALVLVLR